MAGREGDLRKNKREGTASVKGLPHCEGGLEKTLYHCSGFIRGTGNQEEGRRGDSGHVPGYHRFHQLDRT